MPDEGHIRKLLSYQIEQRFYVHLAPLIPEDIAVATCFSHSPPHREQDKTNITTTTTTTNTNASTLLLTDLRASFPVAGEETAELTLPKVNAALDWLAGFHGFWWGVVQDRHNQHTHSLKWTQCVLPPLQHVAEHGSSSSIECYGSTGGLVWQRGGYSHLATRRKEYESLRTNTRSEWSRKLCQPVSTMAAAVAAAAAAPTSSASIAELVDMLVYPCRNEGSSGPYQTLIHGDVKSENLFSSLDSTRVAFYDFQYVGLGLGVSDLAKLFTVSVPLHMLVDDEGEVYRVGNAGLGMGQGEEELLRKYWKYLEERAGRRYEWSLFVRHWEAALVDWLRFQASWGFWGNAEWLEGRVRRISQDEEWLRWLLHAVKPA